MTTVETLRPVEFPAGAILGLTPEQAARRDGSLAPLGRGQYRALARLSFKIGERLGMPEGVPKALGPKLRVLDVRPEKASRKAASAIAAAPSPDTGE